MNLQLSRYSVSCQSGLVVRIAHGDRTIVSRPVRCSPDARNRCNGHSRRARRFWNSRYAPRTRIAFLPLGNSWSHRRHGGRRGAVSPVRTIAPDGRTILWSPVAAARLVSGHRVELPVACPPSSRLRFGRILTSLTQMRAPPASVARQQAVSTRGRFGPALCALRNDVVHRKRQVNLNASHVQTGETAKGLTNR
jgi:hypothetical protein